MPAHLAMGSTVNPWPGSDVVHRHRLGHVGIRIQRVVHIQVLRVRVALDEQRTAALALDVFDDLPGVLLVALRIGTDQRNAVVTQVTRRPDRAVLGVNEVRATAWVRILPTSIRADSLPSFRSTAAILFDWFAATMK